MPKGSFTPNLRRSLRSALKSRKEEASSLRLKKGGIYIYISIYSKISKKRKIEKRKEESII